MHDNMAEACRIFRDMFSRFPIEASCYSTQDVRMRCLDLALRSGERAEEIVRVARLMESYVSEREILTASELAAKLATR